MLQTIISLGLGAITALNVAAGDANAEAASVRCYRSSVVIVGRVSDPEFRLVRFRGASQDASVLVENITVLRAVTGVPIRKALRAYKVAHVVGNTDQPFMLILAPSQVPGFDYEIAEDVWLPPGQPLPQVQGECLSEK